MERLMEIAKKVADRVEIYSESGAYDGVSFENARLKDIDSSLQSGAGLLLIKDGRLGYAYTRNLIDREGLVRNALASIKGGVEAGYDLPLTKDLPELKTYDAGIEDLTSTKMVDECERICGEFAGKTEGQLNVSAGRDASTVRVMNSSGTDLSSRSSSYYAYTALYYPGSYSSISRVTLGKKFVPASPEDLDYILGTYNGSLKEVKPATGRTRVLFLPETIYALIWRLKAATQGKSVYEQVSPLKDKLGEKIVSDRLTVLDRPLDDTWPGARAFDDEGTACRDVPIVEDGVLRNFYYDRYYAWKMNAESTGHGFRPGIVSRVTPSLEHTVIKPGTESFAGLLKKMGKGIIAAGVMGAHSGNILNGDFSIGLSPGLYVEDGEIVGQVKDAMVAGNIYDTLQNVIGIGDRLYPASMGKFPAVLLDDVSFAAKG